MTQISLLLMAITIMTLLYLLNKWLKKETVFQFLINKQDLNLELITDEEYSQREKKFNYWLLGTFLVLVVVSLIFKYYVLILESLVLLIPLLFDLFGSKKRTTKTYRLHLTIEGKDSVVHVYDHWLNEIPENSQLDIEVGKSAIDGSLSIRKFRKKEN